MATFDYTPASHLQIFVGQTQKDFLKGLNPQDIMQGHVVQIPDKVRLGNAKTNPLAALTNLLVTQPPIAEIVNTKDYKNGDRKYGGHIDVSFGYGAWEKRWIPTYQCQLTGKNNIPIVTSNYSELTELELDYVRAKFNVGKDFLFQHTKVLVMGPRGNASTPKPTAIAQCDMFSVAPSVKLTPGKRIKPEPKWVDYIGNLQTMNSFGKQAYKGFFNQAHDVLKPFFVDKANPSPNPIEGAIKDFGLKKLWLE